MKIGRILFPIFFAFICSTISKAQKSEIGIGLGGLNYTGEVAPNYNLKFYRPAGQVFYRHNFSPVVSLKGGIMAGNIYANERNSVDPIPKQRQEKFSGLIAEIGVMAEYNFFNYRGKKGSVKYGDPRRYSPYLTGGIALFNSEYSGATSNGNNYSLISIPIGVGIKYKLNEFFNLGVEFVARKTFSDELDGLTNAEMGKHRTGNPLDDDWYYFTGVTLSYTFYSIICPEFNK